MLSRRVCAVIIASIFGVGDALATDGYYDSTWAGGGRFVFAGDFDNPDVYSFAGQVALESNGNLLLGGRVSNNYWWLGELLPGGTPVLTFGESNGSGLVTSCHLASALCNIGDFQQFVLQGDGRIDVMDSIYLVRTLPGAHALDTAGVSGGNGYAALSNRINDVQGTIVGYGGAFAAAGSGKWIFASNGYYSAAVSSNFDFAAARLNPDFSLDTSFNAVKDGNGVTFAGGQLVAFDLVANGDEQAVATIVQNDRRIVLVGSAQTSAFATILALSRLNADGSVDTSFGNSNNGKVTLSGISTAGMTAQSVKADRAGRLLVASQNDTGPLGMSITRLSRDGVLDTSFQSGGVTPGTAVLQPAACTDSAAAHALAVDSAGRILVVGSCSFSGVTEFLVMRLRGDGTLDTSFGIGGFGYGRFGGSSTFDDAYDVIFDDGGHPVIAGRSDDSSSSSIQAGVARLTYDLIYTNDFESVPRGCLPPDCN